MKTIAEQFPYIEFRPGLRACLKIKLGSNIGIGLMHLNLKRVALTP